MYKTFGLLYGLGVGGYMTYQSYHIGEGKNEDFLDKCMFENAKCTKNAVSKTVGMILPENSIHLYRSVEKGLMVGVLSGLLWPVVGGIHLASFLENSIDKRFCD